MTRPHEMRGDATPLRLLLLLLGAHGATAGMMRAACRPIAPPRAAPLRPASPPCARPPPRAARPIMQQREPPPPQSPATIFESLFAGMTEVAEKAVEQTQQGIDTWVNSGWQLKKRAGKAFPEITPNAVDVSARSSKVLLPPEASTNGAVANGASKPAVSETAIQPLDLDGTSALTDRSTADLQSEFLSYLSVREEEGLYKTTASGELVFRSREDLGALVARYTYEKLAELAVAARALSRYVGDLEAELEEADEAVVGMRRELMTEQRRREESERRAAEVEAEKGEVEARLDAAVRAEAAVQEEMRREEERAEESASRVLSLQARSREMRPRCAQDAYARAACSGCRRSCARPRRARGRWARARASWHRRRPRRSAAWSRSRRSWSRRRRRYAPTRTSAASSRRRRRR